MAAVTATVVSAGAAAYSAKRQSDAAKDAANAQAEGGYLARRDAKEASRQARADIGAQGDFGIDVVRRGAQAAGRLLTNAEQDLEKSTNESFGIADRIQRAAYHEAGDRLQRQGTATYRTYDNAGNLIEDSAQAESDAYQVADGTLNRQYGRLGKQYDKANLNLRGGFADLNRTQGQVVDSLEPMAGRAQDFDREQADLLGMNGDVAYQNALSRVADPLQAEQERAILRNNAALGDVSGNVLSELAEQTRNRTEANINNRVNLLGGAKSQALSVLGQMNQARLDRSGQGLNNRREINAMEFGKVNDLGQIQRDQAAMGIENAQNQGRYNQTQANMMIDRDGRMSDMTRNQANMALQRGGTLANLALDRGAENRNIVSSTANNLANLTQASSDQVGRMFTNQGLALGNAAMNTGTQLSQLSQNIGNAQAGYHAFRAQQTPGLIQGINSGIAGYQAGRAWEDQRAQNKG